MKHDRKFWTGHVEGWRTSGLTQKAYCQRHRLTKGTLSFWISTLKRKKPSGSQLVEIGKAKIEEQRRSSPIELVVEGRYLLRLWPGMEIAHMQDVLSVLERRS